MQDDHGRIIDYARISITDRCNLRCVYCMPEEGVEKCGHADILTFEGILRVAGCLADLGVRKFKVTGGEPLVRRGVPGFVGELKRIPGVESVTMTTNGILLPSHAEELRRAGLDGVNVSIDTVDPELYAKITRGGDVNQALAGVDAALAAGFPRVKVNCVPLAGMGAEAIAGVAALARDRNVHVRFIEMMPMGRGELFTAPGREELRSMLKERFGALTPCREALGNGPAEYYALEGFAGRIGFIQTLDHGICSRCNRVRLTADGVLKACLHMDVGVGLKDALSRNDDGELERIVREAIERKPAHHEFAALPPGAETRGMSRIGG